jgi:hypothetical protein
MLKATPRSLNALAKASGVDVGVVLAVLLGGEATPGDVRRVSEAFDLIEAIVAHLPAN